jgi:hypothetical protein
MADFEEDNWWAENAHIITKNPEGYEAGKETLSFPKLAKRGQAFYTGRVHELRGEGAIVHVQRHEVIAQFYRYSTKLCYGWHKFNTSDFDIHYYEECCFGESTNV